MNINQIKNYLTSKIGSRIVVEYYGSRNFREQYEGIIYRIYNNVFTIKLIEGEIKSFSYVDIMIKTIKIYI